MTCPLLYLGRKLSDEHRQKLSESHKGHIPSELTKKKLQEPRPYRQKSITQEMINDVKDGMTRKRFKDKYNYSERIWIRAKNA